MSKFLYSLAIEGTRDQLEELVRKLRELGYKRPEQSSESRTYLITGWSSRSKPQNYDQLGYAFGPNLIEAEERKLVNASNPDYVLALAAMREGPEFYPGEAIIAVNQAGGYYTRGKLYIIEDVQDKNWVRTIADDRGKSNAWGGHNFRKATFEEIALHFTKQLHMSKKIIGYKAPISYFGGKIAAGTIYMPLASIGNIVYAATKDGKAIDGGSTNLPKELVETWEAVYETEKKTLIIGSNNTEVVIEGKTITARGSSWDYDVLKTIRDSYKRNFVASGYEIGIPNNARCIRIGCAGENNLFSIEEIAQVIKAAEEQK